MNTTRQTVMITGAAGHLGRAVAARFRAQGAQLVLVGRDAAGLQRTFGEDGDTLLVAADLLDADQVAAGTAQAVVQFGRIHALCHLAGGFRMGESVHLTSAETWRFMMDVNARCLLNVAHAVVPHMIAHGDGKIVTVGAAAAGKGAAHMGAYGASKSALLRLTEAMSAELRHKGINVNCVLPSIIDTADNRAAMPDADPARWVAPEALAEVIAFLASDGARAIHGASVPVTGLV